MIFFSPNLTYCETWIAFKPDPHIGFKIVRILGYSCGQDCAAVSTGVAVFSGLSLFAVWVSTTQLETWGVVCFSVLPLCFFMLFNFPATAFLILRALSPFISSECSFSFTAVFSQENHSKRYFYSHVFLNVFIAESGMLRFTERKQWVWDYTRGNKQSQGL